MHSGWRRKEFLEGPFVDSLSMIVNEAMVKKLGLKDRWKRIGYGNWHRILGPNRMIEA